MAGARIFQPGTAVTDEAGSSEQQNQGRLARREIRQQGFVSVAFLLARYHAVRDGRDGAVGRQQKDGRVLRVECFIRFQIGLADRYGDRSIARAEGKCEALLARRYFGKGRFLEITAAGSHWFEPGAAELFRDVIGREVESARRGSAALQIARSQIRQPDLHRIRGNAVEGGLLGGRQIRQPAGSGADRREEQYQQQFLHARQS